MTGLWPAIAEATKELGKAGVPSPRADAEELAAVVLGASRAHLWRYDELSAARYAELVARRARREPLQHITGVAHFRHVSVAVGPGVFVPRPETELVAGAAIAAAAQRERPLVVDLCTGSAAIALAVAHEVPTATVVAVESDPDAWAWAARNCAGSRVGLHREDVREAVAELDGSVDVVVANPPYIPTGAVPRDPEVRDHDPLPALYAGPDGLAVLRLVERAAFRLLRPGGLAVVEHADTQGRTAPALFDATDGWADVRDHRDLAGRDRYLTARRAP